MKSIVKLFFLCCFAMMQAHTVWLETKTNGKLNQKQEIKIFFGELDDPTPTKKWFSDIKDLELKIVSPSGKETLVKEKTQSEGYYTSVFTPTEKGVYKISVKHLVKDTHRKMKITYQSVAFVNVDTKETEVRFGQNPLELSVKNKVPKIGEEYEIKLFASGVAKSKEKLKIVADNTWEQSLTSGLEGEVTFKPLWKGKYLAEYTLAKKESGTHNGQPYETDYEMVTYLINVEK